jgi:type I restriction enzyme S subunit
MSEKTFNLNKSNWGTAKFGELADEISQRVARPGESKYSKFVGLEHFVSGDIKLKKFGSTNGLASSGKAFEAGDILFARRNAYLRRASLVNFDGVCSGDAFVLREKREKVASGFLSFFSNSERLWNYANENAAGTMSKRVKWRATRNTKALMVS